jgi:hypothetical protein
MSAKQTNGCGRAPPNFAPRWIGMQGALWKLRERIDGLRPRQPPGPRRVAPIPHQLTIICRARFGRSFDEMPSPTSLARQGSLCCRGSVKQQDDGFGIRPRSGLSVQTRRQLAILNTIQSGDSLMSVVPSLIVLVITALLVFRRELTTRPAAQASKPTPVAKRRPLGQTKPRLRPRT